MHLPLQKNRIFPFLPETMQYPKNPRYRYSKIFDIAKPPVASTCILCSFSSTSSRQVHSPPESYPHLEELHLLQIPRDVSTSTINHSTSRLVFSVPPTGNSTIIKKARRHERVDSGNRLWNLSRALSHFSWNRGQTHVSRCSGAWKVVGPPSPSITIGIPKHTWVPQLKLHSACALVLQLSKSHQVWFGFVLITSFRPKSMGTWSLKRHDDRSVADRQCNVISVIVNEHYQLLKLVSVIETTKTIMGLMTVHGTGFSAFIINMWWLLFLISLRQVTNGHFSDVGKRR